MYHNNSSNSLDLLADTLFNLESIESSSQSSFKCPIETCGRDFTSKRNLVDHLRGHHQGGKPHACSYPGCGKSFLRPAHLLIHTRIHTGEKPFECPFENCGKKWNQKSALKQHIRSHTGEKPFHCSHKGCEKSFSTSSSCKRHIQTHPKLELDQPARVMDALANKKRKTFELAEYSNIRIDLQDGTREASKISKVLGAHSPYPKSSHFSNSVVSMAMQKPSLVLPRSPRQEEEEGYLSSSSDCNDLCDCETSESDVVSPCSPCRTDIAESLQKMNFHFILN